jgi:predicted ATPase
MNMKKLQEWLPKAHFEKRRGTQQEAIAYCTKPETRVDGPFVEGTPAKQGERSDLDYAADLAKTAGVKRVAEEMPSQYLRYHKGFEKIRQLNMPKRSWKTEVIVLFGAAGAGKTKFAYDRWPDLYRVNYDSQGKLWLDGYDGEETILMDEFYGQLPYNYMKELMDRYPMRVHIKGGMTQWAPKRLVITSNTPPWEWYKNVFGNKEHAKAFMRRLDSVVHYHSDGSTTAMSTEQVAFKFGLIASMFQPLFF